MVIMHNTPLTTLSQSQDGIVSTVRLYTQNEDHYSHRIRFALQIKKVNVQLVELSDIKQLPKEMQDIKLDRDIRRLPILMERDLILYDSDIIIQYIEERFPTPPLIPMIPQQRALFRMVWQEVSKDIIAPADAILKEKNKYKLVEMARKLRNNIIDFSFEHFENFEAQTENQTLDIIDCIIAPILWRFKVLGINIRGDALKYKPLMSYMNYIFKQKEFVDSCSASELRLHIA